MSGSLADEEHAAYRDALAVLAHSAGGSVNRHGGVTAAVTGSPIAIFNHVLLEGTEGRVEDLEASVASVAATGLAFTVSLRKGTDDRFALSLGALGLTPGSHPVPGMALHPMPYDLTVPELDIRSGPEFFSDHCTVVSAAFGLTSDLVDSFMSPELAEHDGTTIYAGYEDDRPVCSSLGLVFGSSVTVFNVATVPEERRRGLGRAMTIRTMVDAREKGCDTAFLQSTAMGLPVYRRLGFETVIEYAVWSGK